jgi:hypothetical protein
VVTANFHEVAPVSPEAPRRNRKRNVVSESSLPKTGLSYETVRNIVQASPNQFIFAPSIALAEVAENANTAMNSAVIRYFISEPPS